MITRPQPTAPPQVTPPPLRAGANASIGSNPLGFFVRGPRNGADWRHPFAVTVSGSKARVARGMVYGNDGGVEPTIKNVPVSGDEDRPQPVLALDATTVNAAGESWVCVEVTPDDEGMIGPKAKEEASVVVVQRDHPVAMKGEAGRWPLALLVYRGEQAQVFQVTHFNLHYVTAQPADGPRTHFFL